MSPFALKQQQVLKQFIRIENFYCNIWGRRNYLIGDLCQPTGFSLTYFTSCPSFHLQITRRPTKYLVFTFEEQAAAHSSEQEANGRQLLISTGSG